MYNIVPNVVVESVAIDDYAGDGDGVLNPAESAHISITRIYSSYLTNIQVVAGSHELGQDYEHVTLLWERFLEFARDTEAIGCERVAAVNEIADR